MATKKSITEATVESKLKTLYNLQKILSEIDNIKTLRGELPLEVQDLEDEITGITTRLNKYEEKLATLQKDITYNEAKISESQATLARYKEQIDNVSNNREYDALTKEIEYQELEIQLYNKKIREAKHDIERYNEDYSNSRQLLDERRGDLELKKSELDEIVSETRSEEEKLREKAKNLELGVDPRLLSAYKRIRKSSRNGLGIVYVERDACGGCFNKIPPQRQLDIRMRSKIIVCEYCGRIMIDPELAGVEVKTSNGEEKPKRRSRRKKTEE
ncbi:MAG: C4-type zinc ribbon domain-containing protein [Bacteroidaceae bacterium]|nr:C4-type zinc ribbon domain-containing protein [Bacteroidaceae bacterium]